MNQSKLKLLNSLSSKLFASVCVCAAVSGCATSEIEALRKQMNQELNEIRGIQAEHTAQINEVRSEVRSVTGKVEEVQYVSQGRAQELEKTLKQLGSRVPPPAGVPEDLLNADDAKIASITGAAADSYREALMRIRGGDFSSAASMLKSFVETNPGTAFTDNALFWSGICYSRLGDTDRAVVAFSDVFRTYPAEDMVAPALYFLGETFERIGSKEDAQLTFQKLIDEHPRSEFSSLARGKVVTKRPASAGAAKKNKR